MGHLTAIPLTPEQADAVERLAAKGIDPTDIVAAGIEALAEQDATFTAWLRAEVQPAIEEMDRDPSSLIPAEEVFEKLRAYHTRRLAEG